MAQENQSNHRKIIKDYTASAFIQLNTLRSLQLETDLENNVANTMIQ
jgi:hypothetical protein